MNYLGAALAAGCIAYSIVLHFFILDGESDGVRLLLVLLPLLLWGCWISLRSVSAGWRPLVVAAFAAAVYLLMVGQHMRLGLIAVDGMWHASMNAFLLWLFARTLRARREPLISRVARHLHGADLPPEIAAYTRNVTLAWSLFFAAQLLGSALLYLFAPISYWSLFVNVLNTPLLVLMFAGEYAIRTLRHPEHARNSVTQVIAAFSRNFTPPRKD